MNSISPTNENKSDNETLNASLRLRHPTSSIKMVLMIIIALFKQTLNNAYLDIRMPNMILVTNASEPTVIVDLFMTII